MSSPALETAIDQGAEALRRCILHDHSQSQYAQPAFEALLDTKRALFPAAYALGAWMSAALDDPDVCDEMKRDINAWFAAMWPEDGPPSPPDTP